MLRSLRSLYTVVALVAASAAMSQPIQQAQPPLPTTRLAAGMHLITAEVAATPRSREIGLMFRTALAANQGMLFVFDAPGPQCMWMRNTLIALSVAFVADDGTIVNIEDMQPQKLDSHCARQPVRYALEMERGWFAKRGIQPGARIGGLPPPQR